MSAAFFFTIDAGAMFRRVLYAFDAMIACHAMLQLLLMRCVAAADAIRCRVGRYAIFAMPPLLRYARLLLIRRCCCCFRCTMRHDTPCRAAAAGRLWRSAAMMMLRLQPCD